MVLILPLPTALKVESMISNKNKKRKHRMTLIKTVIESKRLGRDQDLLLFKRMKDQKNGILVIEDQNVIELERRSLLRRFVLTFSFPDLIDHC